MDSVVQVSNHTVDLKLEPQKEPSFSVQIMYKSVFKTIQCVYSLNPKGFVNRFYHICDITNMYKGLDDQVEVTMGLVGELLVGMQHHGGETVNIRRPIGSSTAERK